MDPVPPVVELIPKPKSNIPLFIFGGIIIFSLGIALGLFFGKNLYSTPPITSTPTPLPAEAPAKEGDPTANWKTYSNNELRFSFQYPPNLRVTETETNIQLAIDPPDPREIVGICPRWFNISQYDARENYSVFQPVTSTNFNGQVADFSYKTNGYGCTNRVIFINSFPSEAVKPKLIIQIQQREENPELLDQILSTFKFVEPEPTKCIQIADPCNPKACGYDLFRCNK